jgi:hypothetical protein
VQALAGVLLPSATVFLLLLCNDRDVLGPWRNSTWLNVLASIIVSVLVLLSLILMATTVFPHINVARFALIGGAVLALVLLGFAAAALRLRRSRYPSNSGRCRRWRCFNARPPRAGVVPRSPGCGPTCCCRSCCSPSRRRSSRERSAQRLV